MRRSAAIKNLLELADQQARAVGARYIEPEHILLAVCKVAYQPDMSDARRLFDAAAVRPVDLADRIRTLLRPQTSMTQSLPKGYSPGCQGVLEEAEKEAREWGESEVQLPHLLISLIMELRSHAVVQQAFEEMDVGWTALESQVGLMHATPAETVSGMYRPIATQAMWREGHIVLGTYEVRRFAEADDGSNPAREGGQGLVYRVWHREWATDLALKVPSERAIEKAGGVEPIINEARAWTSLGLHPNIVSCYYVRRPEEEEVRVPCIFAEYVDGASLDEWIRSEKLYHGGPKIALGRILDIAIQAAWGLSYTHSQGLLHQDVKPSNLMITYSGEAKLTDFGLTRAKAGADEGSSWADVGAPSATYGGLSLPYCSREQLTARLLEGRGVPHDRLPRITTRTDVWGWGLSLLAMLAGGAFWCDSTRNGTSPRKRTGARAKEHLKQFLRAERVNPQSIPANMVPPSLVVLLECCFDHHGATPGMRDLAQGVLASYGEAVEEPYSRQEPRPAKLLADGWNNRGLSFRDIGEGARARRALAEARRYDAHHPESTYNSLVISWREAEISDDEVVRRMAEMQTSHEPEWVDKYLLGLVHLERDDVENAIRMFEMAQQQAPDKQLVTQALDRARDTYDERSCLVASEPVMTCGIDTVSLLKDHRFAVVGTSHTASGANDSTPTLVCWEIENARALHRFQGFREHVSSTASSPDGHITIIGGAKGQVWTCDAMTDSLPTKLEFGATRLGNVRSVRVSPDGMRALLAGTRAIVVYDLTRQQLLWSHALERGYLACTVAWESDTVIFTTDRGETTAMEINGGRKLWSTFPNLGYITSIAVHETAGWLVCGNQDGVLTLMDLGHGAVRASRRFHSAQVSAIDLTDDGAHAISASHDQTVRWWSLSTDLVAPCRCIRTFRGHRHFVSDVRLANEGRSAVSVGLDRQLCLWRLPRCNPQPLAICRPRGWQDLEQAATAVSKARDDALSAMKQGCAADAHRLAVKGLDVEGYSYEPKLVDVFQWASLLGRRKGLVKAWLHKRLHNHGREITAVAATPVGASVVSASRDGTLRSTPVKDGVPELILERDTWLTAVAVDPGGLFYVAADGDGNLHRCDADGALPKIFSGHEGLVACLAISPDGRLLASGGEDQTIRLWSSETGKCLCVLPGHQGKITCLAMSQDERLLVSGAEDRTVRVWSLPDSYSLGALENEGIPARRSPRAIVFAGGVAVMHSEPELTGASPDGPIGDAELMRKFEDHRRRREELGKTDTKAFYVRDGEFLSIAISPNGRHVVGARDDGLLLCWNLETGLREKTLAGHTAAVSAVCFSPDGRHLLSGSWDKTLRLWDFQSGRCLRVLEGHTDAVTSVCFTPDARFAFSGGYDHVICCWGLRWDAEFPPPDIWDSGADLHLAFFLADHTRWLAPLPVDRTPTKDELRRAVTRGTELRDYVDDVAILFEKLRFAGFGWLSSELVRQKLDAMAAEWKGPPALIRPATILKVTESPPAQDTRSPRFRFCTRCGRRAYPHTNFCTKCGRPLPVVGDAICRHCGRDVFSASDYCDHCGGKQ